MFFSIIIPAYNVEDYIERCLNSIIRQDYNDYEVIIVNDCSTDTTQMKIQPFLADSRVSTIKNSTNSGLSISRNNGIRSANGKYLLFVDSDDFLESNCLKAIHDGIVQIGNPDVVYLGYYLEKNGSIEKRKDYISAPGVKYTGYEFVIRELNNRCIPVPACFAAYKRKFIVDNNLFFKTGIFHEDELWAPIMITNAKTIGALDIYFYHYVIREDSITQKKDRTKNGLDLIESCNDLVQYIKNDISDLELKKLMNNHVAMVYLKAMCRGKLYRKPYCDKLDRWLPFRLSCFTKDKMKGLLFGINYRLYYYCDKKMGHNI